MRIDKHMDTIRWALKEAIAYFEERADADYPNPGLGPIGNEEMTRMVECQEALDLVNKICPEGTRDAHQRPAIGG